MRTYKGYEYLGVLIDAKKQLFEFYLKTKMGDTNPNECGRLIKQEVIRLSEKSKMTFDDAEIYKLILNLGDDKVVSFLSASGISHIENIIDDFNQAEKMGTCALLAVTEGLKFLSNLLYQALDRPGEMWEIEVGDETFKFSPPFTTEERNQQDIDKRIAAEAILKESISNIIDYLDDEYPTDRAEYLLSMLRKHHGQAITRNFVTGMDKVKQLAEKYKLQD